MPHKSKSLIPVPRRNRASREIAIPLEGLLPAEAHYRSTATLGRKVISSLSSTLVIFVIVLLILNGSSWGFLYLLGYLGVVFTQKAKTKRLHKKNTIAVEFLNDARYDDASVIFEALTRSEQNSSSHPIYIYNRGVAFLLSGDHLQAFSLFNSVLRAGIFSLSNTYFTSLYSDMATCLILEGRVQDSKYYLDKSELTAAKNSPGILQFSQTLYRLRNHQYIPAFNSILTHWSVSEETQRYPFRRATSVLLAFSAQKSGHESHIQSALEQLGEMTAESYSREFYWLYKSWPELWDFIKTISR